MNESPSSSSSIRQEDLGLSVLWVCRCVLKIKIQSIFKKYAWHPVPVQSESQWLSPTGAACPTPPGGWLEQSHPRTWALNLRLILHHQTKHNSEMMKRRLAKGMMYLWRLHAVIGLEEWSTDHSRPRWPGDPGPSFQRSGTAWINPSNFLRWRQTGC